MPHRDGCPRNVGWGGTGAAEGGRKQGRSISEGWQPNRASPTCCKVRLLLEVGYDEVAEDVEAGEEQGTDLWAEQRGQRRWTKRAAFPPWALPPGPASSTLFVFPVLALFTHPTRVLGPTHTRGLHPGLTHWVLTSCQEVPQGLGAWGEHRQQHSSDPKPHSPHPAGTSTQRGCGSSFGPGAKASYSVCPSPPAPASTPRPSQSRRCSRNTATFHPCGYAAG